MEKHDRAALRAGGVAAREPCGRVEQHRPDARQGRKPELSAVLRAIGSRQERPSASDSPRRRIPIRPRFMAAVRAALPTNKAPDLFTWWSTYRMKDLIDQGLVADLTDLWDKHKAEYPQGVRDAFTFNGKVYGLPLRRRVLGRLVQQGRLRQVQPEGPHHLGRVPPGLRDPEEEQGHPHGADGAGPLADIHHVRGDGRPPGPPALRGPLRRQGEIHRSRA